MLPALAGLLNRETLLYVLLVAGLAGGAFWWHKLEVTRAVEDATHRERTRFLVELGAASEAEAKGKLEALEVERQRNAGLEAELRTRREEWERVNREMSTRWNRNVERLREELLTRQAMDMAVPDAELDAALRRVLADLERGRENGGSVGGGSDGGGS